MLKKKRTLYLGLDASRYQTEGVVVHFPIIHIEPRPWSDTSIESSLRHFAFYTHVILTSQTSCTLLRKALAHYRLSTHLWKGKKVIVVGKATALKVQQCDFVSEDFLLIAQRECAEGIVEVLDSLLLQSSSHLFWPHSSLSRPLIRDFCQEKKIALTECVLYEPKPIQTAALPRIEDFDEVVFTSPSTVEAFLTLFGALPPKSQIVAIGPVTADYLLQKS